MSKVYIDGKIYHLNPLYNLLQACLSIGLNIPYFCWHPLLGSLGACRQCAVIQYDNFEDNSGRLIMSCMTPVVEGAIISLNNYQAQLFRKNMIELLLTNHPHDCPVCEEGGHCHLQDMTVMTQHNKRSYNFKKRTHNNQYLGAFLKHEMNRCIGCYRCVRYYKDYADGNDFNVYGANNNIYFGRVEDGTLENEHSGNLIEICPTGVFTDKIHSKRYNRKWDMQYAPSVCQHCSVGCNISIGERYGEIRRVENRYHEHINHYLICDLGRFGHSYTDLNARPQHPTKNIDTNLIKLNFHESVEAGVNFFKKFKNVIGVGSIRSSIENNFSLQELVGSKNFSTGMSNKEQSCIELILNILKKNNIYIPSLKEIETYDVILIIGEDLTQTSSRVALAVRQAIKNKTRNLAKLYGIPLWNSAAIMNISQNCRNSLYIIHTHETKLDDIAKWCYFSNVKNQVLLASAIAHEVDNSLPGVKDLDDILQKKAILIAKELISAKKVLIISGVHSFSTSIIKSSFNIAQAIKKKNINEVGINFMTFSSNSLGVGLIGGMSIDMALKKFTTGQAEAIIFMEYDLYRYITNIDCNVIFKDKNKIITLDHQYTETYKNSGLSLSSTNFVESTGTVINFEGRSQRFFQVYDPYFYKTDICLFDSWKWLHLINVKLNKKKIFWHNLDDVIQSYVLKYPDLSYIQEDKLNADFRIYDQKIARSPNRFSGRTSSRANINVHEIGQPQDHNSIFSFSMEGYNQPHKSITHIPFAWFPGWNSPQALNKFQKEVGKSLISGNSGVFLFKNNKKIHDTYLYIQLTPELQPEGWRVIPYYHLFQNEELVQYSPIVQDNISTEYLLISRVEALKLGLKENSMLEFSCLKNNYCLPIRLSKFLNHKQIALPIGRKNFPFSLIGQKIKNLREFIK